MEDIKQASIYMRVIWLNDNENLRPETLNIKLEGETTEEVVFSISKEDKNIGNNDIWENVNEWANGVTYDYQKEQQETEGSVNQDEELIEISNIPYVIPSVVEIPINYRCNIIKNAETEEYAYYTIKMTYIATKPRKAKMMSARNTTPTLNFNGTTIENVNFNGVELDKVYCNNVLVFEKKPATFSDLILKNSTLNEGTPDFTLTATTDEGLWTMEDEYGTSYYFRGAVNNNYIYFANHYWRIIRINGNGSIRIIYDGNIPHINGDESEDRVVLANTLYANYSSDARFIGYMYANLAAYVKTTSKEQAQTNSADSNIKTVLEDWYNTNIANTKYSNYVSDEIFCNDREVSSGLGYGTQTTYYAPSTRVRTTKTPQFTCSQENDKFTVSQDNGNGYLSYPIGSITIDESMTAGGVWSTNNLNYYLYKGNKYWTISPHMASSTANMFVMDTSGNLNYNKTDSSNLSISPVINLKADVEVTGTGTMQDPYVIVGAE